MVDKRDAKTGFTVKYKISKCNSGMGIFADQDIRKGDLVFVQKPGINLRLIEDELSLRKILKEEFTNNEARKKFLEVTFGYKGLIYQNLDDGKYTNHSESPNVCLQTFDKYVACKDIRKGEEIVENYYDSFENPEWLVKLVAEYGVDPMYY